MNLKSKFILPLASLTTTSILFVSLSAASQASADEKEIHNSSSENQNVDSTQAVNVKAQSPITELEKNNTSNSDAKAPNTELENENNSSNSKTQTPNAEQENVNNADNSDEQVPNNENENKISQSENQVSNAKSVNDNNVTESDKQDSNLEDETDNTSVESNKQTSNVETETNNNTSEPKEQDSNSEAVNDNNAADSDNQDSNSEDENDNTSVESNKQTSNVETETDNNTFEPKEQNSNSEAVNDNNAANSNKQDSNSEEKTEKKSSELNKEATNKESIDNKENIKEDNYHPTIPKGNQGIVKKNKYPIILAHGFSGYPDESKPAVLPPYWGGNKVDLDKELNKQGYDVREGGMSPFGSDYDRALELYYYIKGGTVDYGAYHAEKFGHDRYGKTYEGIYPEWEPGKKVHLVGHSFGGQTIQVLEDMLRNGVSEEIDYQKKHGGELPTIFKGGNYNMVSSVTTVATPHNGTFISDKLGNKPLVRKLFFDILKHTSNKYTKADYGLEPWGLKQRDDESYLQYLKRVRGNKVWKTEDTSFTDGSIEGSKRINDRLTLSKDVAYTSITAEDTHKTINNRQRGNLHMFAPFKILANLVGRQHPESWRKGDGPVPLKSGLYPFNKPHKETTFDSTPELGVWGVMPTLKNWDHMDLVGWDLSDTRIKPDMILGLYEQLANYLAEVEKVQEGSK
ncbi:TPA: lipase [Staphylococcus aureus]